MNVVILSAYFPHFDLVLMLIIYKNILTPILAASVCFNEYINLLAQICPPRQYEWTSDDSFLQFGFCVATTGVEHMRSSWTFLQSTACLCAEWTKRNSDRKQDVDFTCKKNTQRIYWFQMLWCTVWEKLSSSYSISIGISFWNSLDYHQPFVNWERKEYMHSSERKTTKIVGLSRYDGWWEQGCWFNPHRCHLQLTVKTIFCLTYNSQNLERHSRNSLLKIPFY